MCSMYVDFVACCTDIIVFNSIGLSSFSFDSIGLMNTVISQVEGEYNENTKNWEMWLFG